MITTLKIKSIYKKIEKKTVKVFKPVTSKIVECKNRVKGMMENRS